LTRLTDIPFCLDGARLAGRYRIRPGSEQEREFRRLTADVQAAGRPKAVYETAFIDERGEDWVSSGGVRFTSRALRKNLDPVERFFPYVATCGTEVDEITVPEGDVSRKAWLYFLKGELLQAATVYLQEHLERHYHVAISSTMNPGSGDADLWPLAQQRELFSLLGDVEGEIGVKLTESWLLIPEMSVSGILFATETDFQSCRVCHREKCPSRRAAFDQGAWDKLCGD